MFFFVVWGSKWRYNRDAGGRSFRKQCPACRMISDMHEVVPTKYFTLFWLPLFETDRKQSVLECSRCEEHFYLTDDEHHTPREQTGSYSSSSTGRGVPDDVHVLICDRCMQSLRVPQLSKTIEVTCPKCQFQFRVRSGVRV
jgi:phage FluMu protein Com